VNKSASDRVHRADDEKSDEGNRYVGKHQPLPQRLKKRASPRSKAFERLELAPHQLAFSLVANVRLR